MQTQRPEARASARFLPCMHDEDAPLLLVYSGENAIAAQMSSRYLGLVRNRACRRGNSPAGGGKFVCYRTWPRGHCGQPSESDPQALNTLGDTVAPCIGSIFLLGGALTAANGSPMSGNVSTMADRIHQSASFKPTYLAIAGIIMVLAVGIALFRFPRLEVTSDFRPANLQMKQDSIWNHPHLYLAALAIFVYVARKSRSGTLPQTTLRSGNRPSHPAAGHPADLDLLGPDDGRSLHWVDGHAEDRSFHGADVLRGRCRALVLCSLLGTGYFAVATFLAVGIFSSIMFPTIFTLGVAEIGPLTSRGSGLLVRAIVCGAAFPAFMGCLADKIGIHHALALPFLCYLYVIFYGLRGYRIAPDEPQVHIQSVG